MSMMLYKVESLPGRGEEKVVYKLVLIFWYSNGNHLWSSRCCTLLNTSN